MNVLPVKFKLEHNAVMPKYAHYGDVGLDLVAWKVELDLDNQLVKYDTGVSVEIPYGYFGLLSSGSRISKYNLILANGAGIIDSGYRGTLRFHYRLIKNQLSPVFQVGDVVGQLIILPYPIIAPEEAEELSDTERGIGGFGSTASD